MIHPIGASHHSFVLRPPQPAFTAEPRKTILNRWPLFPLTTEPCVLKSMPGPARRFAVEQRTSMTTPESEQFVSAYDEWFVSHVGKFALADAPYRYLL